MKTSYKFRTQIKQCLKKIDVDSLSYFAATSKPEMHIRDCIAYELHKRNPSLFVLREKSLKIGPKLRKRVDLVIQRTGEDAPELLIELKAMISSDALTKKTHFLLASLKKDLACIKKIESKDYLGIMIVTHSVPINNHHENFKYNKKFESFLKNKLKREDAIKKTKQYFEQSKYKVDVVKVKKGQIWGNPVQVDFLLISCK